MQHSDDIISKLWHLCNILRESGITYPEYVTELTYLIFLKMAEETGSEKNLPEQFRWGKLARMPLKGQFGFYRMLLVQLRTVKDDRIREIFAGAETCLRHPRYLALLVKGLDEINWYAAKKESAFADLYEGLLEKNSSESKAGAGQYFTPRPLIECIVEMVRPRAGETVQDPACGTAGFLIAADRYVKRHTNELKQLSRPAARFQEKKAFVGVELVAQTHKLALMNSMLHGIQGKILLGDALGDAGESLKPVDLVLTNPPFGTKRGAGLPERSLPIPTTNKQLAFLQHIYLALKRGGRAAVVLPDLQGSAAPKVCAELMNLCDLHTVLRLPTGIFYAQGVKTNVYFFTRGKTDTDNTKNVWIYDMRSNMPTFNRNNPLTRAHFAEFEKSFGSDPFGKSERDDKGDRGRFRCFSRDYIREHGDTLDITWPTRAEITARGKRQSPDAIAGQIMKRLQSALKELTALQANAKRKA